MLIQLLIKKNEISLNLQIVIQNAAIFEEMMKNIKGLLDCCTKNFQPSHENKYRQAVLLALDVLEWMHEVNSLTNYTPFQTFYLEELSKKFDIKKEFIRWASHSP